MRKVPTLGIRGPVPEVMPAVPTGPSADFHVLKAFADGMEAIGNYVRPIAIEEAEARGANKAREELASGEPMTRRQPFTVANRAFNATASRVLATNAAVDAQAAVDEAVRTKGHDPDGLKVALQAIRTGYVNELEPSFPQLRPEFEAMFDRQAAVANRKASEYAAQQVIDRDKASAMTALQAYERGVAQLALAGGTPAELAGEMAQMQELLIQYGPRGEFELNGKKYPRDDSRSGTLSLVDIQKAQLGARENVEVLTIQGAFARSGSKGAFARRFKEQLLSGEAPVDPSKGLALLNSMEAEVRSLEAAGRARRNAVRTEMRERLRDVKSGRVTGFPVAADWDAMLAEAGGDSVLQAEIKREREATTMLAATRGMPLPDLQEYAAQLRERAAANAAAGIHDEGAIEVMQQLERENARLLDAITNESVGLKTAQEAFEGSGALTSPEAFEAMRSRAAGDAEVLAEIDKFQSAVDAVGDLRGMSDEKAQRFVEELKISQGKLAAATGPSSALNDVVKAVEGDLAMRRDMARTDPVQAAALQGVAVPELDFTDPAALGVSIAARSTVVGQIAEPVGGVQRLLRPSEVPAVDRALRGMDSESKLALIDAMGQLPEPQQRALTDQLNDAAGNFGYIASLSQAGNHDAAALALRGAELRQAKVGREPTPVMVQDATISLGLDLLPLDATARSQVVELGTLWAIGKADGGEITAELVEEGMQRAMFRQEDGTGGLVDTDYGTVILPPGYDRSSAELAISSVSEGQLLSMNGGVAPRRIDGAELTVDDVDNATLVTVEPGVYALRLEDGSLALGEGPAGHFVMRLDELERARVREQSAVDAAANVEDAERQREVGRQVADELKGMQGLIGGLLSNFERDQ